MTDDTDLFVLNVVFLVAASALAIVLTSCLWNHIHPEPHSFVVAALASFRILAPLDKQQQQQQHPAVSPAQEESGRKSTRSKDRRRRGKDPLKDLFKGGKKSKALLKAIKATDHDPHAHSDDGFLHATEPGNDSASSTSRSHSPSRDLLVPEMCAESDEGSARVATPNSFTSASAVASSGDLSDHSSSDASSQARADRVPCPASPTPTDMAADASSASIPVEHVSVNTPSSPHHDVDVRAPQPRDHQTAAPTTESCAKLIRARTKLRVAKLDSRIMPRLFSSALPDSMASSFSSIPSAVSCPSLFITSSTSHSTDGAGPSTPTNSRGPTPPPRPRSSTGAVCDRERNAQPLDQDAVSAQMQLASLHGALEAARAREEQLRIEAEQASKERDEFRWKWNEDAGVWHRREAELHAQIHHLMQQLQAYAAVASFQAQQASTAPTSGFSSPTSPHVQHFPLTPFPLPPAIQAQNSASPPAHVQALLASTPMLTCQPPGFAAHISGSVYANTGRNGISPLLWSGMGLCVPNRDGRRASDSSASGSSSRGRRRRRRVDDVQSTSDESSSLGELEDEDEEDVFRNNALADAILKRPESIRELGGRGRGRPPMHENGNGVGVGMDVVKDPALESSGVVAPLVHTDMR